VVVDGFAEPAMVVQSEPEIAVGQDVLWVRPEGLLKFDYGLVHPVQFAQRQFECVVDCAGLATQRQGRTVAA